jgi:hypothetical protein
MKKVLLAMLLMVAAFPCNSQNVNPSSVPQWFRRTLKAVDLSAAATSNNVRLMSLPKGGVVHGVKIKHSQAFSGGAIASYTLSVGVTGNNTKYASAFDVKQAPSATAFQMTSDFGSESHDLAVDLTVSAVSTGANLSVSTSGVVDVWVLMSVAH